MIDDCDAGNLMAILLMLIVTSCTVVLIIPWPNQLMRTLLHQIKKISRWNQLRWTVISVFSIVFIMFVWNFYSMNTVQNEINDMKKNGAAYAATDMETRLANNMRKFRFQRNTYVTGFTLFSFIILVRFYTLLSEIGGLSDAFNKE